MRKIIIALACCTVLLLIGYASYRGYRLYRENNWMKMARDSAAISDKRSQMLCLQQVLRVNSKNLEANRMMAGLMESSREPSALLWRRRVVELNPRSTEDRLALGTTAVLLRDYVTATNALAGMEETAKKTASYHSLAGSAALVGGRTDEAEAHFIEASRLEPWNAVPQFSLAVVRLQSTNVLDLADARNGLRRVSLNSTNLNLRCEALRQLIADAVKSKQVDQALTLSSELLKQTNSVFRDRLIRLQVLSDNKQSDFKAALAETQRVAAGDDGRISELAMWQMTRTESGPRETLAWLQTLPPQDLTNPPVLLVLAECRANLKDWSGLQRELQKQNWGESDFLRHAFLAYALRGADLAAATKAEWRQARELAGTQAVKLGMLLQFAARWNWNTEAEEILWAIVNQYPENQMALQALTKILYKTGRTRPLLSLFTLQAKRKPGDLSVKNNLAMTAFLLDAQELKPHDLAREIYQKAPTNSAYCSTYAFSLHLQKKDAEALKVMQQIKPKALEDVDTGIAGYYGLILKATGDQPKALTYLGWALKGDLLPEEKKLFEQARSGK